MLSRVLYVFSIFCKQLLYHQINVCSKIISHRVNKRECAASVELDSAAL